MKHPVTIQKVLIANRGEIAVRIHRACQELEIKTVQVYSMADRHSMAVQMADESLCIGPAPSAQSYLNKNHIIEAAKRFKVQAIHPGYGFLSENADFAKLCQEHGFIFIGPSAQVIAQMGDKSSAKSVAKAAGVATTPGSDGIVGSLEEALEVAVKIGYPVLLKASAGGGGKGMRIVHAGSELERAFNEAKREALSFFGDESIYIEKYLTNIRHIEIQVLADLEKVLVFSERDCSIQRRNQKLIEESPASGLDAKLQQRIASAALQLCQHVGYQNAGTIEFILDMDSQEFYFMEMNTRIQVEHPVTEMVTSFDLVKAQIQIASGQVLEIQQKDLMSKGHAIECRINAEDSKNHFMPSPGKLSAVHFPGGPGVRIDSHVFQGYTVPMYYDSLLAKVICWGRDRAEALARMRRVLHELRIEGVSTTKALHLEILDHPTFTQGEFNTQFLSQAFHLN
jgi:acetyl-CoA carboxylase biotin carboxylase subunit